MSFCLKNMKNFKTKSRRRKRGRQKPESLQKKFNYFYLNEKVDEKDVNVGPVVL